MATTFYSQIALENRIKQEVLILLKYNVLESLMEDGERTIEELRIRLREEFNTLPNDIYNSTINVSTQHIFITFKNLLF